MQIFLEFLNVGLHYYIVEIYTIISSLSLECSLQKLRVNKKSNISIIIIMIAVENWSNNKTWFMFILVAMVTSQIPPGTCSMKILKNPPSLTEPRYFTMFLWLSLECSLISSCNGCTSLNSRKIFSYIQLKLLKKTFLHTFSQDWHLLQRHLLQWYEKLTDYIIFFYL